jgi:nucleoside-diphosphate-sugar epimerase
MKQLFCLGLGYSAEAYIGAYGGQFGRITGTVRSPDKQQRLSEQGVAGHPVTVAVFDSARPEALITPMTAATHLLVSAPPPSAAAAALAAFERGPRVAPVSVVYLSSLSVYGDHGGSAIDETAALLANSERGRERIAAENAWMNFGQATASPVAILRLAGTYGPERNALVSMATGGARRIVKPGQVFNRIHLADIAQTVDAAFAATAPGFFNVADDEPAPPQDVIAYAAKLLGQTPPPEISYADAQASMSPMARSFYSENKRAANLKIKTALGVTLRYPNYRLGLDALFAAGNWERRSQTQT